MVHYNLLKAFSALGVLVGIAGAVVFGIDFGHSWIVCTIAALGSVTAGVALFIAVRRDRRLKTGHIPESNAIFLRIFGGVMACIALIDMTAFLAIAIDEKQPLTGESDYIKAIWGFLLFKWAIVLVWLADSFNAENKRLKQITATASANDHLLPSGTYGSINSV